MTFIETWAKLEALIPQEVYSFLQKVIYQKNDFFIDIWLFIHFLSGSLMAIITKNPIVTILILIIFEILENGYFYPNGLSQYETMTNTIIDIVVAFIGWLAARYIFFNGKISIKSL